MRSVPRAELCLFGALSFCLAIAVSADAQTAQSGCRCATTFQGTGPSRVVACEGFNPQTHQRCECEQIQIGQQTGCRPLSSAGTTARNPTPRPGRNG